MFTRILIMEPSCAYALAKPVSGSDLVATAGGSCCGCTRDQLPLLARDEERVEKEAEQSIESELRR